MENDQIIIYQTPDGQTSIDVTINQDTVWLSQNQMVELFQSSKQNISLHINNLFNEGELEKNATVKEYLTVQNEGKRSVKRKVEQYSLDVIISVGYRVKSKRGIQFRIWANKILKEYLVKGYALHEKRLNDQQHQFEALKQTVRLMGNVLDKQELSNDEATGLLKVITDYTYALDVLDKYDHRTLTIEATHKQQAFTATYAEAMKAIQGLRDKFGVLQHSFLYGSLKKIEFFTVKTDPKGSPITRLLL